MKRGNLPPLHGGYRPRPAEPKTGDPSKCAGIFGLIFGHKYLRRTMNYSYTWEHCWRCGKRAGVDDG